MDHKVHSYEAHVREKAKTNYKIRHENYWHLKQIEFLTFRDVECWKSTGEDLWMIFIHFIEKRKRRISGQVVGEMALYRTHIEILKFWLYFRDNFQKNLLHK